MTSQFGINFDFNHFTKYQEKGVDTWHFQIVQNKHKREKLLKEAEKRHHHEVALEHIKSDQDYIIENN